MTCLENLIVLIGINSPVINLSILQCGARRKKVTMKRTVW